MIKLGAYYGNNLVTYPEFFLDLGYEGITHIRGLNKDGSDRNNGSGKSLLLRGVADILFSENPILGKSKKDLYSEGTCLTIEVGDSTIEKKSAGSIAYLIDGEKVNQNVALEHIREVCPITSEDFFTYCYIDGLRPYSLTLGSSLDRIKILSNIFRLDGFSLMYDWFGSKLSELNALRKKKDWLQSQIAEVSDIDSLEAKLNKAVEKRERLKVEFKKIRHKLLAAESAKEHNAKVDRRKQLAKLVGEHTDKDLIYKKIKSLDAKWSAYRAYKARRRPTPKPTDGDVNKLRLLVATPIGKTDIASIEHRLIRAAGEWWFYDHATHCGDKCPVCLGVNKKSYAGKLEPAYQRLTGVIAEYRDAIKNYGIPKSAWHDAKSQLDAWELYLQNREYDKETATMQVDKPKLAEGYYDKIYSALVEMETLPDTKVEVGEDSDLEERIEVANSFILGLEKQLAVARQTTSNNDKVLAQLEDVDTQLKDYEVLRCLQEAYGNKGIKNSTLLDICSRLESNLNYWSWSVFPEPIHFAIEVSHSKIDILAYRNPCTDFERVSDVRHLSGGESRAFNLLLLLSLLPLIPSSRRLNIVVLDECTANMDNQTKRLVFEQYIPLLTDIVPHVIVLDTGTTPIDGAQELYAVKEMGITNLLETI